MTPERLAVAGDPHPPRSARCERLPNGLTILTEEIPHLRSLTLGVWILRGSRHEPPPRNGTGGSSSSNRASLPTSRCSPRPSR